MGKQALCLSALDSDWCDQHVLCSCLCEFPAVGLKPEIISHINTLTPWIAAGWGVLSQYWRRNQNKAVNHTDVTKPP